MSEQVPVRAHPTTAKFRLGRLNGEHVPGRSLVLQADMKVPGIAWLHMHVITVDDPKASRNRLELAAIFEPHGIWGYIYWYALYPIHLFIFRGMARSIMKQAQDAAILSPTKH